MYKENTTISLELGNLIVVMLTLVEVQISTCYSRAQVQ